jgi:hypothetical protein
MNAVICLVVWKGLLWLCFKRVPRRTSSVTKYETTKLGYDTGHHMDGEVRCQNVNTCIAKVHTSRSKVYTRKSKRSMIHIPICAPGNSFHKMILFPDILTPFLAPSFPCYMNVT